MACSAWPAGRHWSPAPGGGLGFAFADALSKAGAHVVLAGRTEADLVKATDALRERGGDVSHVVLDVADTKSVDAG
jgi:NAD(P)-dependent dehydrogenase (short-subunit alcohol dehydrogenase family)